MVYVLNVLKKMTNYINGKLGLLSQDVHRTINLMSWFYYTATAATELSI